MKPNDTKHRDGVAWFDAPVPPHIMNEERYVVISQDYGQVQMVSTYIHTRETAEELARLHRNNPETRGDVFVAEVLERNA